MTRHKRGTCKDCGTYVGKDNLSNKHLCYFCAKKRMVDYFNDFWGKNHPVKASI